jgi:hypothetical protein
MLPRSACLIALTCLLTPALGCSSPQPLRESSASPTAETTAPPAVSAEPVAPAEPAAAEPAASATPASAEAPVPSTTAEAEPPPPDVEVKNIGMHVGGGKNDAAEKAPIKRSVEPHFGAFAKCFAKVESPEKGGDFGVDIRIEREGGLAKVDHPRTSLKGDDFKACVLGVFTAIDFEKPKGGTTMVSYSLRFTPKKGK